MIDTTKPRRGRRSAREQKMLLKQFIELALQGVGKNSIARKLGIGPTAFLRLHVAAIESGKISVIADDWELSVSAFPALIGKALGVTAETLLAVEIVPQGVLLRPLTADSGA